jgi:hypothetical protein
VRDGRYGVRVLFDPAARRADARRNRERVIAAALEVVPGRPECQNTSLANYA